MIVRSATEADLPAILTIYNEAVLHTVATADVVEQSLAARQTWYAEHLAASLPMFVAEEGGQVLGWGALNQHRPRYGYRFTVENSVYVAVVAQGRGVGKLLLTTLIASAKEGGYHTILAGIDSGNTASLHLHAAFGFQTVAQLKEVSYKFDRWLDVIYMQLMLDDRTK